MIKKLHVSIPFIDACERNPLQKEEINEHETYALGDQCSVVVLDKLPTKLQHPSSFFIPYLIENASIHSCLLYTSPSPRD